MVSPNGGTTVPSRMTPAMRDILSLAEGDSDLWLPAVGVSNSIVDVLAKLGWIVATLKGDRVYIQLTDAGRAVLSIAGAT
jgi:DNA-binding PadR family transcriptional regulator